jgi:hypothetical protein
LMGYMKKMYMEMLLEPSAPPELPSKYSILENAVDSAILDLEKVQAKGVYTQHRLVLAWTALRTLKQAREKCRE